MPHHAILALTALLFLLFGAFSTRFERGTFTAPMFCVLVGLAAGPLGLGVVEVKLDNEVLTIIAEVALAVILFTDASGITLSRLRQASSLPARLLGIGLPLTILLGMLAAIPFFPDIPLIWLAVIACILAPTDAALGVAIVQSPLVPQRVRDTLNVESGLNDGIALPPVLALLVLAGVQGGTAAGTQGWLLAMVQELALGALVGAAIGQLGGRLLDAAWRRGWMKETFARLVSPGLTILAFSSANLMNLNGFVAAYLAGLLLGVRDEEFREKLRAFGEADGAQFSLFVFLLFGLSFLPVAIPHWNAPILVYALLSLTLVRMLPVALSLAGAGLDSVTIAFIGWSGPRGIASVLYLTLVLDRFGIQGHETIFAVIVLTVFLSISLHGMSAAPLARAYGGYVQGRKPAE